MDRLRPILEDLRETTDLIVERWSERVQAQPWLSLPEEAKLDHVPELVEALIGALLGEPSAEEARTEAVRMAVRHGRHRRDEGLKDDVLHREHHLLRASIWDVIRERHGSDPACFEAIALIDVASTMTTTGSLHGYHQDGADDRDATVDRLAEEGPWPEPV
ncbi:MAG: hypothetical protein KY453_11300 [Gemmatimonadetes bacterium]|nr:hypothetical protein [Gemmatimonadota bacterium]